MLMHKHMLVLLTEMALLGVGSKTSAEMSSKNSQVPSTANRPMHQESAQGHDGTSPPLMEPAALPEGMTLEEVFDYSETPPPRGFPDPVPDDEPYAFTLFDQLEYRIQDEGKDHLGWEAQGYLGYDIDKFWWKSEGEAVFEGQDEGESENDLLYSRLITPFWNFQIGAQYANEWTPGDYGDRWSGVIALQGLAPYKFELDNSLYLSEDGDVTFEFEGEYSIRITQRLVLQPRTELTFAAQDVPERRLGAGMTDATADLRLRYEIKRELAPYLGVRYQALVGETDNIAEAAGEDTEHVYFLSGVRLAF